MKSHFSESAKDLLKKLLTIDPNNRLSDPQNFKRHPFFEGLDWDKLYRREIRPPVKPKIRHKSDLSNFDASFTSQTPTDSLVISKLSPGQKEKNIYEGFTFKDSGHI